MAAARIVRDLPEEAAAIFADSANPTLAELRALPQGKKMATHRSCLHDDITCILISLEPEAGSPLNRSLSRSSRPEVGLTLTDSTPVRPRCLPAATVSLVAPCGSLWRCG